MAAENVVCRGGMSMDALCRSGFYVFVASQSHRTSTLVATLVTGEKTTRLSPDMPFDLKVDKNRSNLCRRGSKVADQLILRERGRAKPVENLLVQFGGLPERTRLGAGRVQRHVDLLAAWRFGFGRGGMRRADGLDDILCATHKRGAITQEHIAA